MKNLVRQKNCETAYGHCKENTRYPLLAPHEHPVNTCLSAMFDLLHSIFERDGAGEYEAL